MNEFFSMGGFGAFIWSAMAVALVLMIVEPMSLLFKRRAVLSQIKRTKRLEQRQIKQGQK